ncbi:SirB1 family protein [Dongia mobilis]|jgi:regulator of sirC expression with transglutaminase-like and TPR domain|uniref:SirB1 family protein n=1 Tax=Dongia sp. TaxID=1977262 RepID=UPI0026F17E1D
MNGSVDIEADLNHIGAQADAEIDLAEAALALAAVSRPEIGRHPYRAHLAAIADAMKQASILPVLAEAGSVGLEARCHTLADIMAGEFSYRGDRVNYDDLQNADLMRVIDRRQGLPVALAILYIHAARSLGWAVEGVNFPGHFVIRLFHDGKAAILDPFDGGRILETGDLRQRLKSTIGETAELQPSHYAAIGNRDILLRLQNNIKVRLIQDGDLPGAAAVVERILLVAPEASGFWREAGLIHSRLGNLLAAKLALSRFLELADNEAQRHQVARLLQDITQRLQ